MTQLMKEFREFAVKGNMVDMAVGIIIGAAFGKIVSSLVGDIFMPVLGLVVGGVNFTDLKVTLRTGAEGVPAVTLNYGQFLQMIFDFLIVALAMFAVIKAINSLKREAAPPPAPPAPPRDEVVLLGEIRDLLKQR
jgi:large conductance mechanosensitive channel